MKRLPVKICLLLLGLVLVFATALADTTWRVVRSVRLLTKPSSSSGLKIKTLHPPEQVTRLSTAQSGNYIKVRDVLGDEGWVYEPYLTQEADPAVPGSGGTAPGGALGPDEMRAHFIDVGQGAATLLEFSCGAVLIDTGGEKDAQFDSNQHLLAYLTSFFGQRPDLDNTLALVVLSHPHIDHTRGVETVLQNFNVRNVVDDGLTWGSGASQQAALETYARDTEGVGYVAAQVSDISATSGLTNAVIDPVNCSGTDPLIRVLWGEATTNPGWSNTAFENANNHSVIVRVDFGQASFLLPGDLENVAMPTLIQRYAASRLLDVDVFEVDHHGSRNGVTAALLAAITPKIAVISMGPADRELPWTAWKYGHPNQATVDLVAAAVSETRTMIRKPLGTGAETFTGDQEIQKAIYATGWDGNVVIRARADGTMDVLSAGPN